MPYQGTMDKTARIRSARIWDRQLFKALRCSLWDVMLGTAPAGYGMKMRMKSKGRKRTATAKPYQLLNVPSTHTSFIR